MTAPSNANTSGLEVVATVVSAHGDPEAFGEREIEVVADLSRIPYNADLVTAASAQARIAELDEQLAQAAMMIIGSTSRATAAEARADRLAKALEALEAERKREGVNLAHLKRAVAVAYADMNRAALQQEKQP